MLSWPLEVGVTAARCDATVHVSRKPDVALGTGLEMGRAKEQGASTTEEDGQQK